MEYMANYRRVHLTVIAWKWVGLDCTFLRHSLPVIISTREAIRYSLYCSSGFYNNTNKGDYLK